jgi:hypothetical protein
MARTAALGTLIKTASYPGLTGHAAVRVAPPLAVARRSTPGAIALSF